MRPRRLSQFAALALLTILATGARAASVSYVLDQSNADPWLPDGEPYLQVTVADGAAGAIDFTVEILPRLTGIADSNFGLKAFAFSSQGAANVLHRSNITGLPAGWSISFGRSVGDFGAFDVVLTRGTGGLAVAPLLTFSIVGVSADTIADYAVLSRGQAVEGHVYFAALVGGFLDQDPRRKTLTRAWFGGTETIPVVPLPGAMWLFLTAVGALAAAGRTSARASS